MDPPLLLEGLLQPQLARAQGRLEGHGSRREGDEPRDHLAALGRHPDDGGAGAVGPGHPDQTGRQGA